MWMGLLKEETRNWLKKLRFESIWDSIFFLEISGFLMVVHSKNANTHTRGENADNLMHLDSCIWDFADRIAFLAVVSVIYPSCVWSRYFLSQNSAFHSNYSGIHVTKGLRKTLGIVELFERAVLLSYLSVSLERLSVCVGMLEYGRFGLTCLNLYVASDSSALSPAGRMG